MNLSYPLTEIEARGLVMLGYPSFADDSKNPDEYFTYYDIALLHISGFDGSKVFNMSAAQNNLTGQLTYSSGTFPINKSKKMFPR